MIRPVPANKKSVPTLLEEMALFEQGYCFVAGLDEAGRGCLAGPVVAAAVILPLSAPDATKEADTTDVATHLVGVNDSKQLSEAMRERLYSVIMQHALSVGIGIGPVEVIDERNILQATKYAMRLALKQLSPVPQALLLRCSALTGYHPPTTFYHQRRLHVASLSQQPPSSPKLRVIV